MQNKPRYCPYCGSDMERWGHDDNCPRPENVQIVIKNGYAEDVCGLDPE